MRLSNGLYRVYGLYWKVFLILLSSFLVLLTVESFSFFAFMGY